MNYKSGTGNVGNDAELREVNGTKVLNLSVALNGYVGKGKGDNQQDGSAGDYQTLWYNLTLWGVLAESASRWVKKGSIVEFLGEESEETYTTKEGEIRTSRKVRVLAFNAFVVPKSQQVQASPAQAKPALVQEEDDIPF